MPSAASRSTTGVRATVPPLQPRLSWRCWSVVMKRMLRRRAAGAAGGAASGTRGPVGIPARQRIEDRLAREQHGAVEPPLAVGMGLLVVGRRDHVDERGPARVRDEGDQVPVVSGGAT